MRRNLTILAVIASLAIAATLAVPHARAQIVSPTRKLAFVVGVSKYLKDGLRDLEYADKDAEDLAAELTKQGFETTLIVRDDATLKNLEKKLDTFFASAKTLNKSDVAFYSFSGHGMQLLDANNVETPYYCPVDCLKTDPKTLFSLNALMQRINDESGSSQNLLVVDACRDNPAKGTKGVDGSTVKELANKLSVLFGSSSGQRSFESDKIHHGIFTHFLLEGLRGKARNPAGDITWLNLASYVMDTVPAEAPALLDDPKAKQQPNLLGNLVRQPILARIIASNESGNPQFEPRPRPTPPSAKSITNSLEMKLTLIPAGEFMMGSPESEKDRSADEKQHRVKITKPFYLGTYPVTLGEFLQFYHGAKYKLEMEKDGKGAYGYDEDGKFFAMGDKESANFRPWAPGGFKPEMDHPVVDVSWNDAVAFCDWLSKKEGKTYRLPTEAEWEYACRAHSTTKYYYGDDESDLSDYAWYDYKKNSNGIGTHPVGKKKPNAFGLYDMHGNVWQWCSDWYDKDYYGNSATNDPQGADTGSLRVARGGSWSGGAGLYRSANRNYYSPENRFNYQGFRVALVPADK